MRPTIFSTEALVGAAFGLLRREGYLAVTARAVAQEMGCSVQPIYSAFGDMGTLIGELYDRSRAWVAEYDAKLLEGAADQFRAHGLAHIRLAREEPALFEFLYQSPYLRASTPDELLDLVGRPEALDGALEQCGNDEHKARQLYLNLAIYAHGLACMEASGMGLPEAEIGRLMDEAHAAFMEAFH